MSERSYRDAYHETLGALTACRAEIKRLRAIIREYENAEAEDDAAYTQWCEDEQRRDDAREGFDG